MKVILKMKILGLGNPGKKIGVSDKLAQTLVLGGLARYAENVQAETEYDKRETATMRVAEKRGRKKKKD